MATRTATVKVHRPTHVPKELHPVWHGAAVRLARSGRLLDRTGRVNYPAINETYQRVLASYQALAATAEDTEEEDEEEEEDTDRDASRQASVPANWPFTDITPSDIGRMAARGNWNGVIKAARLATGR